MTSKIKTYLIYGTFLMCLLLGIMACSSDQTSNLSLQPGDSACTSFNCWDGIVPGSTTLLEAQTLLETRHGEQNVILNRYNIEWETGSRSEYRGGSLRFDEQGVIYDITIGFSNNQLTVAELISRIGEPSFVWVAVAFSSESRCAGVIIAYPYVGVFAILFPEGDSVGIHPAQSIQGVTLLPLDEAEDWTSTDHWLLEWQGYGDYCELTRNETPHAPY